MDNLLKIANPGHHFGKVALKQPTPNTYLLIAAEIDRLVLPFSLWDSKAKRDLLSQAGKWSRDLGALTGVIDVVVFNASVIPPGRGKFLKKRPHIHQARFDLVLLIELDVHVDVKQVRSSPLFEQMLHAVTARSKFVKVIEATNCKRIDTVNHARKGIFLFNFFHADDHLQNIAVWEYTAGWFQKETELDNSTVLLPVPDDPDYTLINHCRWDRLRDILPSLLFKRSFRSFVLKNFYLNKVAPMPILYRLYGGN